MFGLGFRAWFLHFISESQVRWGFTQTFGSCILSVLMHDGTIPQHLSAFAWAAGLPARSGFEWLEA